MTPHEIEVAQALDRVSSSTGSFFVESMMRRIRDRPDSDLSERQRQYLRVLAWRYRKQMPRRLVPSAKPEPLPPRVAQYRKRQSRVTGRTITNPAASPPVVAGPSRAVSTADDSGQQDLFSTAPTRA